MSFKKIHYYRFKNVFSQSKIEEINNTAEDNFYKDEPEDFAAKDNSNKKIKNLDTKWILYGKIKHLLSGVVDSVLYLNDNHFGFNINPIRDKDLINYNIYSSKTQSDYDWHIDSNHNQFQDIKLTCLINISTQKYEGGDFHIFNGGSYAVSEFSDPGDILVLKSYLNHKVMPVVTGERKTLALFFQGPSFK
tara:strand:- start:588 stop:1160 length:573 start_codon:yes stop_codon:yes gene_type:complete